ncbi:MAG: tetraacyldisaccharide 4'-kinase [Calditrichaeota bacterium]|nr:tetraacyldisaccharide 4'-kinase [Calditrichota bacterium]MCB9391140.1 tetraacyldisaccharide 4'-kinase [Calditrichota bacterium]
MILWLPEQLYRIGSGFYHRRWDQRGGWKAHVPVISVGNLTVGGNGKTPFVIALARLLMSQWPELRKPNAIAVLSRGYGRTSRGLVIAESDADWTTTGDEPLLIKQTCPELLVISNADRVASARVAVEEFGAKVILLDDGFQHRALARDVDIVLFDALEPVGNGRLLPAGRLREPVSALTRATALISVGNGDGVEALGAVHGKPVYKVGIAEIPAKWTRAIQQPCFLVTGIARPNRVLQALTATGLSVVGRKHFRDHYRFSEQEMLDIDRMARRSGAKTVLTTAKDLIRMRPIDGGLNVEVIPHEVQCLDDKAVLVHVAQCLNWSLASESS